jgi:hypothetical protein
MAKKQEKVTFKALAHASQGCEFKPPLDRDSHRCYTLKQGDH